MKKIILNQKSYLLYDEALDFKSQFDKDLSNRFDFIIFPPILYLEMYKNSNYCVGAQNFFSSNQGSFTGEINLESLKSLNINYTIIGNYERKKILNENKEIFKEKLFKSLNSKFNTILCIGEISKSKNSFIYIKRDINYYLKSIDKKYLKKLSIVYEPNWSIGTSEIIDDNLLKKMYNKIKNYIHNKYNINIDVYYGGIITDDNIKSVYNIFDGIVLGKVSTNYKNLCNILNRIE